MQTSILQTSLIDFYQNGPIKKHDMFKAEVTGSVCEKFSEEFVIKFVTE